MWATTCCCFTCFYGQPSHTAHPSPNTVKPVSAYVNYDCAHDQKHSFLHGLALTNAVSGSVWQWRYMSSHSHLSDGLGGKGWSKINMEASASKENLTGTLVFACCVPWLCVQPWCGSWGRPWTGTVFGTVGTSGRPGAEWVYGQRKDQVTGIYVSGYILYWISSVNVSSVPQ